MEVKVKTLKKYILFIVVFSVISIIAYNVYDKKRTEKMREIEMKEDIEEAIDREYKDLLEEYNSIIETIQDYDYSTDFRSKYLYKLNKLLDSPNRYTKNGWYHIDLGDFEDNFETNKDEDKAILRSIAARNVYKKILGND